MAEVSKKLMISVACNSFVMGLKVLRISVMNEKLNIFENLGGDLFREKNYDEK